MVFLSSVMYEYFSFQIVAKSVENFRVEQFDDAQMCRVIGNTKQNHSM